MIVQQVDLVDVQQPRSAAASTPGSKWRSPRWIAFSMSSVPTTRSSVALTGRLTKLVRRVDTGSSSPASTTRAALVAVGGRHVGIAAKVTVGHGADFGQQEGQGTGGGTFSRAALAADQHAADLRMDGIEDERALHALLADDCSKWKDTGHRFFCSH